MPPPYVVETRRCVGCQVLDEQRQEASKNEAGAGLQLTFVPWHEKEVCE